MKYKFLSGWVENSWRHWNLRVVNGLRDKAIIYVLGSGYNECQRSFFFVPTALRITFQVAEDFSSNLFWQRGLAWFGKFCGGYYYSILWKFLISMFISGALRRGSLDPGTRRLSLGTPAIPHRASDACLDPAHAAILFRDARGVSLNFAIIYIVYPQTIYLMAKKAFTFGDLGNIIYNFMLVLVLVSLRTLSRRELSWIEALQLRDT